MKPLLLLSDFDGTISIKDFYLRYAKGPLKELDQYCIDQIHAGTMSSYEYLDRIMQAVGHDDATLMEHILELPIDPAFKPLVERIEAAGGEVVIVSAGSSAYIQPILDNLGLGHLKLYANGGRFTGSGIALSRHPEPSFHCDFYGINKAAVLQKLKSDYQQIAYAGDGSSDAKACSLADYRFGKRSLAKRLTERGIDFTPFASYSDISDHLNNTFFKKVLAP